MSIKQESLFETAKQAVKQGMIKHVAIIMDGNRRWAKDKNVLKSFGHVSGRKAFKSIVRHSAELGLSYLTTYAFSTENWGRESEEVGFLMNLLVETLNNEVKELSDNNVRLKFIGRKSRFDEKTLALLHQTEEETAKNTGLYLQIALDYGSRYEITESVGKIVQDVLDKKIAPSEINENLLSDYLYTAGVPDPDLIIRTGGEYRLSNYLLWQAAYSELYITNTLWPDFSGEEFDKAIVDFTKRQRRWGKD